MILGFSIPTIKKIPYLWGKFERLPLILVVIRNKDNTI